LIVIAGINKLSQTSKVMALKYLTIPATSTLSEVVLEVLVTVRNGWKDQRMAQGFQEHEIKEKELYQSLYIILMREKGSRREQRFTIFVLECLIGESVNNQKE